MKRISIIFLSSIIMLFYTPVFASNFEEKPLEASVTFDWISKTQLQRDGNIKEIQNTLFNENTIIEYNKKDFKKNFSPFFKNKNYLNDYDEIKGGKKEDKDKYYCGFFFKNILVAYGIQYKKDMAHIYYYDAMGSLRWIDKFSSSYPNYPYWSYQYDRGGKMVAAYYCINDYDQYVFTPNKQFKGRWYKDKMYNKNAKVILTRSNYGQQN